MNDQMRFYFKPEEMKFIAMSVVATLEQLNDTAKNPKINWNPEARKDLKDMIAAGTSLKVKLQRLGCDMRNLPGYNEGDENEFLTKHS